MGRIVRLCAFLGAAALTAASACAQTDYQTWIRPYATRPLQAFFTTADRSGVTLKTSAIEGDGKEYPKDRYPAWRGFDVRYGDAVSQEGNVSVFLDDWLGEKGGCCGYLSEEDRRQLNSLLEDLPDDGAYLPPPDRRLVLQVPRERGVLARVYDRANPPDRVLEILRLIRSSIGTHVLNVKPADEWKAGDRDRFGALIASADGKQIITSGAHGPIQFWDADSHALLREIPLQDPPGCDYAYPIVSRMAMNPAGAAIAVKDADQIDILDALTWQCFRQFSEPSTANNHAQLSHPVFTPEGRFLPMQTDDLALRIVDTRTWQTQLALPAIPASSAAYYPSPDGSLAVTASKGGELSLWDPIGKRTVASLGVAGPIEEVAFSPAHDRVAVATCGADDHGGPACRIRVWETAGGQLLHELWPFEEGASAVKSLVWWVDGRYLIAATETAHIRQGRGITVWSMETGRHRAELLGCSQHSFGVALLAGGKLAERCGDGEIRMWDMASVVSQIGQWEKELF